MSSNIQPECQFEKRKEVINKAVKICIECGSLAILIDNYGVFCKECNSKFRIKEDGE